MIVCRLKILQPLCASTWRSHSPANGGNIETAPLSFTASASMLRSAMARKPLTSSWDSHVVGSAKHSGDRRVFAYPLRLTQSFLDSTPGTRCVHLPGTAAAAHRTFRAGVRTAPAIANDGFQEMFPCECARTNQEQGHRSDEATRLQASESQIAETPTSEAAARLITPRTTAVLHMKSRFVRRRVRAN